jgi:beta-lactamase class A
MAISRRKLIIVSSSVFVVLLGAAGAQLAIRHTTAKVSSHEIVVVPSATPIPTPAATPSATPVATPTSTPKPKPTPAPVTAQAINTGDMETRLNQIVKSHPELKLGISYRDLNSDKSISIGGSESFTAASTTKVLIACLFLSQVEEGKRSLDMALGGSTARYHLQQMINRSSNVSWGLFIDLMGLKTQSEYAPKILVKSYNPFNNSASPDDMATLLAKLYRRELLSETNTKLLLSLMQKTNFEFLIPPAVPSKSTFYHKYGQYEANLHDIAIIDDGKSPYVLTIYTNGKGSHEKRYPLFQEIVKAVEATR